MKTLVAVYGTLRKSGWNHSLIEKSLFLGSTRTDNSWKMLVSGIPFITKGEDSIAIEVYEVDEATFRSLDRLEGFPNYYDRKIIDTEFGQAWIYFVHSVNLRGLTYVKNGDYIEHLTQVAVDAYNRKAYL